MGNIIAWKAGALRRTSRRQIGGSNQSGARGRSSITFTRLFRFLKGTGSALDRENRVQMSRVLCASSLWVIVLAKEHRLEFRQRESSIDQPVTPPTRESAPGSLRSPTRACTRPLARSRWCGSSMSVSVCSQFPRPGPERSSPHVRSGRCRSRGAISIRCACTKN